MRSNRGRAGESRFGLSATALKVPGLGFVAIVESRFRAKSVRLKLLSQDRPIRDLLDELSNRDCLELNNGPAGYRHFSPF